MSIVNRRNAVIGWVVVKVGKRAVKKKAQEAAPDARTGGALAGGIAAALAGLFFWRKRSGDSTD